MPDCSRCHGEGEETYDEDGRTVTDVCYHCAGSGKVDEDTHFHDKLHSVASALAYQAESQYRKACNSDPDGDGYDLGAYENQMMPYDYFRCRVWEREPEIAEKLLAMPRSDQEFLIAWKEYWDSAPIVFPQVKLPVIEITPSVERKVYESEVVLEDDDIPF